VVKEEVYRLLHRHNVEFKVSLWTELTKRTIARGDHNRTGFTQWKERSQVDIWVVYVVVEYKPRVAGRRLTEETKTVFKPTQTVSDAKKSYMLNGIGTDLRGAAAINEECRRKTSQSVRTVASQVV